MLQPNRTPIVVAVLSLALATWGPVARADDWATAGDRPGPQFEIYLSSLFASSVSEGSFGLRGAFFLGKRFALEGSLSRIADSRVNVLLADVSAKALAGPFVHKQ